MKIIGLFCKQALAEKLMSRGEGRRGNPLPYLSYLAMPCNGDEKKQRVGLFTKDAPHTFGRLTVSKWVCSNIRGKTIEPQKLVNLVKLACLVKPGNLVELMKIVKHENS